MGFWGLPKSNIYRNLPKILITEINYIINGSEVAIIRTNGSEVAINRTEADMTFRDFPAPVCDYLV